MRRLLLVAALWPAAASAHPVEPLLTEAPMPVPEDQLGIDSTYQALRGDGHTEQGVDLVVAAGIGSRAELSVGGTFDATEETLGPISVGAKLLLVMEGHDTAIDLAVAGSLTSARTGEIALLAGRSLVPGLYLQARVGLLGSSAAATEAPAAKPHSGGVEVAGGSVSLQSAAALQWSPTPRLLPTLEVMHTHAFADEGGDDVWVVPELMFLVDMNHLSLKLAAPIGLAGELEVGVIGGLGWQG